MFSESNKIETIKNYYYLFLINFTDIPMTIAGAMKHIFNEKL